MAHEQMIELLGKRRIVPVIAIDRADDALPMAEALKKGGLEVAEVTFRTKAAAASIRAIAKEFPEFLVGAGTVTTLDELSAAQDAGARFAVAPGLNRRIVSAARDKGFPFFPGVMTPGEIEAGLEEGCQILKFFPAEAAGGLKLLKAVAAPYAHRGVRFIPTGGIESGLLATYLAEKAVLAVGGSWMVAKKLLDGQDWQAVEKLTREAVNVASGMDQKS